MNGYPAADEPRALADRITLQLQAVDTYELSLRRRLEPLGINRQTSDRGARSTRLTTGGGLRLSGRPHCASLAGTMVSLLSGPYLARC